jgi:hypothetical protein
MLVLCSQIYRKLCRKTRPVRRPICLSSKDVNHDTVWRFFLCWPEQIRYVVFSRDLI